ncbi:MAG: 16S rRNA (cytosine(967)-C(5))-methyltransferase RsmB [Candidatus Poribacteria bacterium]
MEKPVRQIALDILLETNIKNEKAQNILNKNRKKLTEKDRAFLTELVYGTIRWKGNLDYIVNQFIPPKKAKKLDPEILLILHLGLYQIFYMDKIPDYAVVNESVEIAKKYSISASGLVNAVFRRALRNKNIKYPDINKNPAEYISAKYSHPEWMVNRWLERFGLEQTINLCLANNSRPPIFIRTNTLKISRDQLLKSLKDEGVSALASSNIPESIEIKQLNKTLNSLRSYRQGWFQVQDESSMLIAYILDPQEGETIIDACSAPGGKSTHIAEIMGNKGKILSFDIDSQRLELLKENCLRLGIDIIEIINDDARNIGKYVSEKVDKVLVDAPCSGLGVLRRRVEAKWRRTPEQILEFSKLQYEILESVSKIVKYDGILVYCTCTIEPEENQQVIEKFLKNHQEFQLESVLPFLPEGIRQIKDIVSNEGFLQIYQHLHNMDGFFSARMRKLGNN